MNDSEGGRTAHLKPQDLTAPTVTAHRGPRWLGVQRLSPETIEQRVSELAGAPLTQRERQGLRRFKLIAAVVELGRGLGLLSVVLFMLFICWGVFGASLGFNELIADVAGNVNIVGALAWVLSTFVVLIASPAHAFAFSAARFDFMSRPSGRHRSHSAAVLIVNESSLVARAFMRVLTGRRINVGVRPELSDYAISSAAAVMIKLPQHGPDALKNEQLDCYRYFTREVVGLLAIGRTDLVSRLVDTYHRDNPELLAVRSGVSEELVKYLHPLRAKNLAELLLECVVPLAAFALSLIAVLISVTRG